MMHLKLLAALALAAAITTLGTPAWAGDARERLFLRVGMHEAEVVLKIGKPDHEAFIANERGQPEEKTWAYFPDPRDPQTMTIVTLRAGVVDRIERKIAR